MLIGLDDGPTAATQPVATGEDRAPVSVDVPADQAEGRPLDPDEPQPRRHLHLFVEQPQARAEAPRDPLPRLLGPTERRASLYPRPGMKKKRNSSQRVTKGLAIRMAEPVAKQMVSQTYKGKCIRNVQFLGVFVNYI